MASLIIVGDEARRTWYDKPRQILSDGGIVETLAFRLCRDESVIGRTPHGQADIQIPDLHVARAHVRIVRRADGYYIEDLRSRNHTIINGVRLEPDGLRQLVDGDRIALAGNVLEYRHSD